jgi:hypothetical protein
MQTTLTAPSPSFTPAPSAAVALHGGRNGVLHQVLATKVFYKGRVILRKEAKRD